MTETTPWEQNGWVEQSRAILDSYERLIGTTLVARHGSPVDHAQRLFQAPFVVVSHNTQPDPLLNYGNQMALDLWKISVPTLLQTPSRMTAEPVHRDERAKLLQRTTRDGFVDDYRGIRIATDGQRFLIDSATVWNLTDHHGDHSGQAATFDKWTMIQQN